MTLTEAIKVYGVDRRTWLQETKAPYLLRHEIICPCGCGFESISDGLIYLWIAIRNGWGKPIFVNSCCRCWSHHQAIYASMGKEPPTDSLHLARRYGEADAIDLDNPNNAKGRDEFRSLIKKMVWKGGFGKYPGFSHADTGRGAVPFRTW